jgi:hypothetical protein
MRHTPSPAVLSAAENAYRLLLFVYPATHRREYGTLMVQAFRDLCRDTYRQKGLSGLVRLWVHVLTDTAVTAAVEHSYTLKKGEKQMTKKQHRLAIILTGYPLGLWLILILINPNYATRMIAPTSAQPVGWMMSAVVFILLGIAYITLRKGFVVLNQPNSSFRIMSGTTFHRILFIGGTALFVFPAMLLVLLGPAIVFVLEAGF